jgi:membrane-bound ClpP family serine protease
MATIINTDKKETLKTNVSNRKENKKKAPLFRKMNYILMGIGIVILLIGYLLLSGGKSPSDEVFSDAIFNTRRLIIAPTLILIGLVVEIFAIMHYPKKVKNKETTEN